MLSSAATGAAYSDGEVKKNCSSLWGCAYVILFIWKWNKDSKNVSLKFKENFSPGMKFIRSVSEKHSETFDAQDNIYEMHA